MSARNHICTVAVFVLITILFYPAIAIGEFLKINVTATGGSALTQTFVTDINWVDVYADPTVRQTWNLTDDLPGGYTFNWGSHNAIIENISVAVKATPKVELGFAVKSENGSTDFLISSDAFVINPITDEEAYVYAEAGSLEGTVVSAVDFGDKLFRALYNGTEIFADAVDPYVFQEGGVYEYIDYTPIAGEISSMEVLWGFNVNTDGHADGLAVFEATPEPASILLLVLGGLVLRRKR